jgi:predicted O-methyltransferase YrrM
MIMGLLADPPLEAMLEALHVRSDVQAEAMRDRGDKWREEAASLSQEERAARIKEFVSDKLVALDRDKAAFCYQLCRAIGARRIVEIGTSYGVSTLYLAAAVRDTVALAGGTGVVIGTEYEAGKAAAARANFAQAGLEPFIELREDDLRQTLKALDGPIDFMLVDIWIEMARPALELVAPRLRQGAIVICDNTKAYRDAYADYFAFLNDPANAFRTMTLPFEGGLELSVRLR